MEDHYDTLGIQKYADSQKVRKAYRECCKKYHPDVCEKGENSFKKIQNAYEVLSDEDKKQEYDRKLKDKSTVRHSSAGRKQRPFFTGGGKKLALDLVLSPMEAVRGGVFPIPVFAPGYGKRTVCLQLQGPVYSGARYTIPLQDAGFPGYSLSIDIIVG